MQLPQSKLWLKLFLFLYPNNLRKLSKIVLIEKYGKDLNSTDINPMDLESKKRPSEKATIKNCIHA